MQKLLLLLLFMCIAACTYSQKVRIKENSKIARLAARINGEKTYAITFGKTIFVSCKKEDFYAKDWWVKHELTHVAQYEKHGILPFLSKYLYHSVFRRNSENPFEKEAEDAERSSQ